MFFFLEYDDFFTCKTSYGNMLLAADFVPVTLSAPSPNVTLSVRQVSKLSCQSGFLRNLIGLLPAHLHSHLEFYLEDGNKVGSTGPFGVLSSRKSPLHTLPKEVDLMVSRLPSRLVPLASSSSLWREPCCQT